MKIAKYLIAGAIVAFGAAGVSAQYAPGQGVANTTADGVNSTNIEFVQRGGGNEYGYRGYNLPLSFTFLPWAFPNCESTVTGARLNLGWGSHAEVWGLDAGVFGAARDFGGISANVCGNYIERDAGGLQIGAANIVSGTARGLQIGFVNYAGTLIGVQIGVINFTNTQRTLPIINIGW